MRRVVVLPVRVHFGPENLAELQAQLSGNVGSIGRVRVRGLLVPVDQRFQFEVRDIVIGGRRVYTVPEWTWVGQLTPDATRGWADFSLGEICIGEIWRMEFHGTQAGAVPVFDLACEEIEEPPLRSL